jgi:hypothetical protein
MRKRKGSGAHLQRDRELFRAALRFARVPRKGTRIRARCDAVTLLSKNLIGTTEPLQKRHNGACRGRIAADSQP